MTKSNELLSRFDGLDISDRSERDNIINFFQKKAEYRVLSETLEHFKNPTKSQHPVAVFINKRMDALLEEISLRTEIIKKYLNENS